MFYDAQHIKSFGCLLVLRPKLFILDGNPSDEFSVSDRNPSSNINSATDVL